MNAQEQQDAAALLIAESEDAFDVVGVLAAIMRGKWAIVMTGLVFALVGAAYLYFVPNTYLGSISLLPPPASRGSSAASLLSQAGLGGEGGALGALGSSLQSKSQTDVFVLILQAWPIRETLVKQFNLVSVYGSPDEDSARRALLTRTAITAGREGVITIEVTDRTPQRAADLANAYVDAARTYLRDFAFGEASQRRRFYESQLVKAKEDLANAEVSFKQMQQGSGMVALDTQAKSLLESAALLRAQITAKEVELQSLRGYLTKTNPQVQIAETELAALQGQVAQLEARGQGGLTGKSLSSVPSSEIAFVRATRELKYQEGLYDLLFKQYEGARIDEARDAPTIQVIEPALVPLHKAGPKRLKDLAIAFFVGAFVALLVLIVRYALNNISDPTRAVLVRLRSGDRGAAPLA